MTTKEEVQYETKMIESLSGANAICLEKDNRAYGWVFYKHPDGKWVTLRRALPAEIHDAEARLERIENILDIQQKG